MKYRTLFLFLALLVPLVSNVGLADIISINSGGTGEYVVIPDQYVEGFFFGDISSIPAVSSQGTTGAVSPFYVPCNYTYDYLQRYGPNATLYVSELQKQILNKTGLSYAQSYLISYLTNWQAYCSDYMKKSLDESYLCTKIGEFLSKNDDFTASELEDFRFSMGNRLYISDFLLRFYIENKDSLCRDYPKKGALFEWNWWTLLFLILILLCIGIIIFVYARKKGKK